MRPTYAYDVEVFKNYFSAIFVNVNDESEKHSFEIGIGIDERKELQDFLKRKITIYGYNNISYDDPVLRYIVSYKGSSLNLDLFRLSSKLVNDTFRSERELLALRYPPGKEKLKENWNSVDLMLMLGFDKLGVSLKQVAINLKWHRIQDIPISPEAHVHESHREEIKKYNLNDVLITKRLYEETKSLRELRENLTKLYGVNLLSASNSKIANLILGHFYEEKFGDISSIKNMRTKRDKILLGKCLAPFVSFRTPQLQEMLKRISSTYVYHYEDFKYSESVFFAGCSFNLGIGGLHTNDEPGIFESDNKFLIQDLDVASYYPNLIINNKFYPKHLGEDFIDVLKKITEERILAKKQKDKTKADGLKITVNSIFGKLGSPTFWLEDAKQLLSTTLSGQMGLLMLVEELDSNGIQVISANTDGLVCKIERSKLDIYYRIAKDWESKTSLELEFTPYKKYVRRDVNSYITEKEDGSTKEKGAFVREIELSKAYRMPIVSKALYSYFIKGVPVKDTVSGSSDIMDFCISQKTGKEFLMELHDINGIEKLQKTNRFFISNSGKLLYKRKLGSNKLTGMNVGYLVRVLNEYEENIRFEDYDVNLSFYEKEVYKIIDVIEPKQMRLFATDGFLSSPQSKPLFTIDDGHSEEENLTIDKINKLGKNQREKMYASIARRNLKIDGISPRYLFIIDFSEKDMVAEIYSLSKGVKQKIGVDKKAITSAGNLKSGQVIYCSKFTRRTSGHVISQYDIIEKISPKEEIPSLFEKEALI